MITAQPLRTAHFMNPRRLFAISAPLVLALLLVLAGCATRADRAPTQITGRVVDVMSNPIAGCTVTPTAMETRGWDRIVEQLTTSQTWRPRELPPVQTNSDGRFTSACHDRRIGDAFTRFTATKAGWLDETVETRGNDNDTAIVIRPAGDELLRTLARPEGPAYLENTLRWTVDRLAGAYFAQLDELSPHLLRVLRETRGRPEAVELGTSAASLLALACAPDDTAVIDDWVRAAGRPVLIPRMETRPRVIDDFPSADAPLDLGDCVVGPGDLIASSKNGQRKVYHAVFFFEFGNAPSLGTGEFLVVIQKTAGTCQVPIVHTTVSFPPCCYD